MADSTTESEYFDECDDDECGDDPLGGVSAQSCASAWSSSVAAAAVASPVAHAVVKQEPHAVVAPPHVRRDASLNEPLHATNVLSTGAASGGSASGHVVVSSAPLATVKCEPVPRATMSQQHVPPVPSVRIAMKSDPAPPTVMKSDPTPPMSSATRRYSAAPMVSIKMQSANTSAGSNAQVGTSAAWPPLPPSAPVIAPPQPPRDYSPQVLAVPVVHRKHLTYSRDAPAMRYSYAASAALANNHVSYSYAAAPYTPYMPAPTTAYAPPPVASYPVPVTAAVGGPAMPHVYSYQPPPPVNYAPPRGLQTQYQSLPVSEAPSATATARPLARTMNMPPLHSTTSLAGGSLPSYSSGQVTAATCRVCRASLKIPVLKIGRDCRCCGGLYPFAQFPTRNKQHLNRDRRCNACYATFRARSEMLKPPATPFATTSSFAAPTTSAALRSTPIEPPLRIPSSPAVRQPIQAPQSLSLPAAVMPSTVSIPALVAQTPVAPAEKCPRCQYVTFQVSPSSDASENLKCVCCNKMLPMYECFSKNQRREGKYRCKRCLGHSTRPSEPVVPSIHLYTRSQQPTAAASKKKKTPFLRVETPVLGAERQVAKYHLARRSLQRKREANDLRGTTRVEYEAQLKKEEAELQVLEKQLRARHPTLFDKQSGIQVKAPSIPRDERDSRSTKKTTTLSRSEKKRAQLAKNTLTAAANAVIQSATARSSPSEVINVADDPSSRNGSASEVIVKPPPKKTRVTMETLRAAAKSDLASLVADESPQPRKRKAAIVATKAIAKEIEAKKQKVSKTVATKVMKTVTTKASTSVSTPASASATTSDDADPWLAAHDEIAQGLSQLLGGILSADRLGRSSANAKRTSNVKSEGAVAASKKQKDPARTEPLPYAPKTKLEAETPPQTTIVTRARRRTLQPVEVIDITDSPPASPRAKKARV